LPAGQLVEIPGPSACVRESQGMRANQLGVGAWRDDNVDGRRNRCLQCCGSRAEMWAGYILFRNEGNRMYTTRSDVEQAALRARQTEFRDQCETLCRGFYNVADN
jgi:hypothetical protein